MNIPPEKTSFSVCFPLSNEGEIGEISCPGGAAAAHVLAADGESNEKGIRGIEMEGGEGLTSAKKVARLSGHPSLSSLFLRERGKSCNKVSGERARGSGGGQEKVNEEERGLLVPLQKLVRFLRRRRGGGGGDLRRRDFVSRIGLNLALQNRVLAWSCESV